ncbi:MAG: PD-(D/E)XK nuclease family protein [Gemmatimonadota bacterium]
MPLQLRRRPSNGLLWSECAEGFLRELEGNPGPSGYTSWLWLTHRAQRDALYEMAAERGLHGWLAPPVSFLSELPKLFEIQARPIGILTGRLLVARLAARNAASLHGADADRERGPARSHALDHVFSELLPEGVTAGCLRTALDELGGDDFARRRNAWVVDTYEAFLAELESRGRFDPRSIHAMVADRIQLGGLAGALGGASKLHIYGLTSLRGRQRLFESLAAQTEVEVNVYLPDTEEADSEWDRLLGAHSESPRVLSERSEEDDGGSTIPTVRVQPVPDAIREAAWVAHEIKQLLADGSAEPHQIAVVARSGREDTRRLHQALASAGVPSTARIRTVLAEIPALRAALWLFRAQSRNWDYQGLRQVLASPYFGLEIDLRPIDAIAGKRRVAGLSEWTDALRRSAGTGFDHSRFEAFCDNVVGFEKERSESDWIDLTLNLLQGRMFDFRAILCRPVGDRWDIVRLDQRGTVQLEALLIEWQGLIESRQKFPASEWYWRLRQLLEANELSLSTPLRQGVQILEAHQAALTAFRHTFVVHANDGVFPRRAARTGVFADEERAELCRLGLPLSTRSETLSRERNLWRSVVQGEAVTITYRTTDASGVPKLPSLMVPDHRAEDELPRTMSQTGRSISEPDHRRDETLRLLSHRRSGRAAGELATADPESLRHAVLTAFADDLRSGALDDFVRNESELRAGSDSQPAPVTEAQVAPLDAAAAVFGLDRPLSERPTAWNGRLRDPVVLGVLASRFGESRVWSASQLQTYGIRPFDYLLDRVLRLGEVEEADEETSALTLGSVNHRILERFYSELIGDLPSEFDARAAEVLDRVAEETFSAFESDSDEWLGVPALWEASRIEVRRRVENYLRWELAWLAKKNESPLEVELGFGFDEEDGPLVISGPDAQAQPASLLFRGRIDRVDRHGSAGWLRVVDYKSGSAPTTGGYDDGALLQSALYMRAMAELGRGSVASGVFRSIRGAGKTANSGLLKASEVDRVLSFALSIPARVRAGLFEAVQARTAKKISPWQPGREITRSSAVISARSRFDQASE